MSELWTPPEQPAQVPGRLFTPARRRQAVVVARDAATKTCSIKIDGDATQHDNVVALGHYVPRVNDTVWCLQDAGNWLIIGGQATELPKGRMRSTATQTVAVAGTSEKFSFNAAGGVTSYDLDNDGTNTMVDRTNSRIVVRWPGKYRYGGKATYDSLAAGRQILDIKLNNTTLLARSDARLDVATSGAATVTDERSFVVGDFIELFITSTGNTSTFGSATGELGADLWMSYIP